MKGGKNASLLINFIPSTGPAGIMRLIHKLPVTPADLTQADANQLIRLQEPLSEYGTFHSIYDLVSNPVVGIFLSRGIPAEQHALHLITCRATW